MQPHNPENLLVFDVETTGTDKRRDQVIELCVQYGLEADSKTRVWRIRPDVPISPGAQAVHGISMEDVADCPRFRDIADEVRAVFEAAEVWVGYNLSFDIEMLQAEFGRIKSRELEVSDKQIVDAFRLWQRCEPRSLQDAHRRFVGGEFAAAHSASADVAATGRVLKGMLAQFEIEGDWAAVAAVCEPERATWVGPSRHLRWDDDGEPTVGFGRHSGARLTELARSGADYLRWIVSSDFPPHVREVCSKALASDPTEFLGWVRGRFALPQGGAGPATKGSGRAAHAAAPNL